MTPEWNPEWNPSMDAARLPLPHKMHLRKGKYYVSVNAPREIEHLYPDKRCRRSTGTSDKGLANERAAAIVVEIMNDFDLKAKALDQFIEACRPYLEKLGSNVQQWYVNGKITVVEGRDKGADYYLTGELQPETSEPFNYLTYDIQTYEGIATFLTRNGYSIPRHALGFLSEDERARLVALSEPTKPKVKDLLDLSQVKSRSDVGEGKLLRELAAKALGNYDNIPAQSPVKIEASPQKIKKFSELIEPYLESRKGERYKEISSRRTACSYFMEFAGDLPITDYKKIHAYDVALGLQDKGLANATISKNITYANGLFHYATERRDEFGNPLLERLPWSNLKLEKYGTKSQRYLPLSHDELTALFSLDLPKQERTMFATLVSTGMRLDEIALMTWERVTTYHDVLCFSLIDEVEGVVVKNKGSMRYIPVPNVLKPILGNGGKGRLFNYRLDKDGKAQAAASKALMPYIRKVTDDPRKVVHSLRGNFKDLVRHHGIPTELNHFLTGHRQGDVGGDRYGDGHTMKDRLEAMNKVQHPWLA